MKTAKSVFNPYLFNPAFWHIWEALHNPKIRKILVRGGSSASKTFSVCDALNLHQLEGVKNVFALRKHRIHVETTIKKSFEASIDRLEGIDRFFNKMDGEIRVETGSITTYSGMDDSEKVKGLESYLIVYVNELNQYEITEWDELNRRLRGKPGQKIVADWNPIIKTHWINQEILNEAEGWTDLPTKIPEYERDYGAFTQLDPQHSFKRINSAGDTIWINTTYRDNFWIVGHPAGDEYGFLDIHTLANFEKMRISKPNDYRIYGLGEDGLVRTGGEAWKDFSEHDHAGKAEIDIKRPLHLSLDKNVVPYVTISAWQIKDLDDKDYRLIQQVHEIPSRPPDNTAFRAANKTADWLDRISFREVIFVYGDPSASARSTEDDDGRSFFDKYIGTLEKRGFKVIRRVQRSAPQVVLSISFVNDLYAGNIPGWRILISDLCRVSLEDYSQVKEDKDGRLLKEKVKDKVTGQTYEKYGHFSDAKRYFIIAILHDLFLTYKNRSGTPRILSQPEP